MSSAKPTNGTLFGSRHDVSAAALKKASTKAQQQQSRRRLQPIDAVSAAGKEFRAGTTEQQEEPSESHDHRCGTDCHWTGNYALSSLVFVFFIVHAREKQRVTIR